MISTIVVIVFIILYAAATISLALSVQSDIGSICVIIGAILLAKPLFILFCGYLGILLVFGLLFLVAFAD